MTEQAGKKRGLRSATIMHEDRETSDTWCCYSGTEISIFCSRRGGSSKNSNGDRFACPRGNSALWNLICLRLFFPISCLVSFSGGTTLFAFLLLCQRDVQ